jgi:hypothetical protein
MPPYTKQRVVNGQWSVRGGAKIRGSVGLQLPSFLSLTMPSIRGCLSSVHSLQSTAPPLAQGTTSLFSRSPSNTLFTSANSGASGNASENSVT